MMRLKQLFRMSLYLLLVLCYSRNTGAETLTITGERVNVRSGPGRTYDVVDVVQQDEKFKILHEQDGWYQISVEGTICWVSAKGIAVVADRGIQELLRQADIYFSRLQFTTPPEANAFDLYRQVLEQDPHNVHALKKIEEMGRRYKIWAEKAAQEGDDEKARIYYQRYVFVVPSDQQIQDLLQQQKLSVSNPPAPLRVIRLRSDPQIVAAPSIAQMIRTHGFNHPADWSTYGLSSSYSGNVEHEYIMKHSGTVVVVIDYATNLMWQQQGTDQAITWTNAYDYIRRLNNTAYAGYNNWRLPTIEELASLMEASKQSENLYLSTVFSPIFWCWSTDTVADADAAWYISFSSGGIQQHDKQNTAFVLAVRSIE